MFIIPFNIFALMELAYPKPQRRGREAAAEFGFVFL